MTPLKNTHMRENVSDTRSLGSGKPSAQRGMLGWGTLAVIFPPWKRASLAGECTPKKRRPQRSKAARVLVEVTSDGTEDYDRGEKLTHYKQIPSLDWVVIVSHRELRIEVWSKAPGSESWQVSEQGTGGMASLTALGCSLNVDAIGQAALEP